MSNLLIFRGISGAALATAVLVLAGCSGETQPADTDASNGEPRASDPFITGQPDVGTLARDDEFLYWSTPTELRRATLSGGVAQTLASGVRPQRLVVSGEFVYFTDLADTVARVPRTGGEVQALGSGNVPLGIAVADGSVYWSNRGHTTNDGSVAAASLDGSSARVVASGLPSPWGLVVHDGFVYFTSAGQSCFASSEGESGCIGGGIHRVSVDGGGVETLDPQGTATELVGDDNGIYWLRMSPPGLMFRAYGVGSTEQLAPGFSLSAVALDSDGVYVGTYEEVFKVRLEGSGLAQLRGDLLGVGSIVPAGEQLFVSEPAVGKIRVIAKDGSSNRPTGPITGPCPEIIGTPEEIALTPRADENLELLALTIDSGRITASQATYDRVVADVGAIRALAPNLADIGFRSRHDGKTIYVSFDDITTQSVKDGDYSAWNCLNDFYGPSRVEVIDYPGLGFTSIYVHSKGIYDIERIAKLYARLPGVEGAGSNGFVGDGPTICAGRDGDRYEYVLDRAGGDCPAGCTTHDATLFASDGAGQVTALATWQRGELGNQPPDPEWFTRLCR